VKKERKNIKTMIKTPDTPMYPTPTFAETIVPMLDLLFHAAVWLAQSGIIVFELVVALTVLVPIRAGQSARDHCLELLEDYELDHLFYQNKDAATYIDRKDFSDHVRYERIQHVLSEDYYYDD
jgi:hypothetical protein